MLYNQCFNQVDPIEVSKRDLTKMTAQRAMVNSEFLLYM